MRKKTIGIMTIIDNNNYGNRLQNYATQTILSKYYGDVITINNKKLKGIKSLKFNLKFIKKIFLNKNSRLRYKNFLKFNKNIKFSKKKYYTDSKPINLSKLFDFCIVGSDQVWNPNFNRLKNMDLLNFMPDDKKISFSASIGVDILSKESLIKIEKNLAKFKAISVREESAKNIIGNCIKRDDIEVLVDPTMVLTSDEWEKVSKKPKQIDNIKKKYILNYFLGELSESRKKEIEKIAQEENCHIINILDKEDPFYACGPSEFLWLEKNAFLICTDSFHSCVFSIIFKRPFLVFDRKDNKKNMNSRIETLLSTFDVEERKIDEYIDKKLLNFNHKNINDILKKERKKSEEFLKKALDIE